MQKIISLFQRNYEGNRLVRNEVVPGAKWVINGEGTATVKWDGTCCMVRDGTLYKRYDLPLTDYWAGQKKRKGYSGPWSLEMYKSAPVGWEAAQPEPDATTGHWPGWLAVDPLNSNDKWHCEATAPDSPVNCGLLDGTYELVGPKIQGNPYGLPSHALWPHGTEEVNAPRTFDALHAFFQQSPNIEGVVWHHPDGRMVKIKRKDFGLPWPPKEG